MECSQGRVRSRGRAACVMWSPAATPNVAPGPQPARVCMCVCVCVCLCMRECGLTCLGSLHASCLLPCPHPTSCSFLSTFFMRAAKMSRANGGGSMSLVPLVPGTCATGVSKRIDMSKCVCGSWARGSGV